MALLETFWRPRLDWDRELGRLLFGRPFAGRWSPRERGVDWPLIDVWETEKDLEVEVEAPGVRREDIEIDILRREVVIRGKRGVPEEREDDGYHRRERSFGEFTRRVKLPVAVDTEKARAQLVDGVLRITLPKAKEALPRRIKVRG